MDEKSEDLRNRRWTDQPGVMEYRLNTMERTVDKFIDAQSGQTAKLYDIMDQHTRKHSEEMRSAVISALDSQEADGILTRIEDRLLSKLMREMLRKTGALAAAVAVLAWAFLYGMLKDRI